MTLVAIAVACTAAVHGHANTTASGAGAFTIISCNSLACHEGCSTKYNLQQMQCTNHGTGIPQRLSAQYKCYNVPNAQCVHALSYPGYNKCEGQSWGEKIAYQCGQCMSDTVKGYSMSFTCLSNGTVIHNGLCDSTCGACQRHWVANNSSECVQGDSGNNFYTYTIQPCPVAVVQLLFDNTDCSGSHTRYVYAAGACQGGDKYICPS
jgi:hypothetical protein